MFFLDRIIETDKNLNLKNLKTYSVRLVKEINYIKNICDENFGCNSYSLLLGGSLALCLRANNYQSFREKVNASDVDFFIIVDDKEKHINIGDITFIKLKEAYNNVCKSYDASCVQTDTLFFKYKFSIKIMFLSTFTKSLCLTPILINEFRYKSLSKVKEYDDFSGYKKLYIFPIVEHKLNLGYKLIWRCHIGHNNDFVLTDYHSVMLLGGFVYDGLKLSKQRLRFIRKCKTYIYSNIDKREITNNQRKLLRYFYIHEPTATKIIFG